MQTEQSSQPAERHAGKYLTVSLAQESYGIGVLKVREIIRHTKITPIPRMPEFVRGVINLRGKVIPVMDLRLRFGLAAETNTRTCIVVVEVQTSQRMLSTGLIVDNVEEVANIAASEIEATPHLGAAVKADYLLGLAKVRGQVKLLLNIDRVLTEETVEAVAQAA